MHTLSACVTAFCLIGLSTGATWAAAQTRLLRVPVPYTFAARGDSPGKVTFNHATHVDEAAPSCTACHPQLFKMLKAGATADGMPITHDLMNQGRQCGACHNGTKAFSFDDCTRCHRSEP
jgi:c(7)-type cytochrome triheme protein